MISGFQKLALVLLTATIASQSVVSVSYADSEDAGTIIGGILGGVIGNKMGNGRVGGTIAGAVIGAVIGNRIGADMDERDRREWARAHRRCLDDRRMTTQRWRGHNEDTYGDFTVVREGYHYQTREVCREYRSVVYYRGEREVTTGVACRSESTWREISASEVRFQDEHNGQIEERSDRWNRNQNRFDYREERQENSRFGERPNWVCYASNYRGEPFRAFGYSPREARRRVMDKCYNFSRNCEISRCDRL